MSQTADRIAALYDWRASRGGRTKDYERYADADVALLAKYVDLHVARLCDVGCGDGTHLKALSDAGTAYAVGIDLSEVGLRDLIDADWAASVVLIRVDVTKWRVGPVFDAVLCSLPPINQAEDYGLETALSALRSITKRDGHILLKLFDGDRVDAITGTYSIVYDGARSRKVSTITRSQENRSIRIRQYFSDAIEDIHTEVVDTPLRSDVLRQAEASGLAATSIDHTDEVLGTRTYVLRPSSG